MADDFRACIRRHRFLILGLVCTPLLLLASGVAAMAGHGTYVPALVLFPFSISMAVLQNEITRFALMIGLFQWPIYGFLLDKKRDLPLIAALHGTAVLMAIGVVRLTQSDFF